ncbi:hypothetical protein SAMN02745823_01169 [Sporobacter termitidis DSM 10068]|uniref:Uncharacterized protein n=2 Tax=Sporobacter TaxID=44748 RepID=A0A1M5WB64_9FIRM|nr:hypothetical protein SAMN02745823_01169 [Sporobacter termitidis DSM 10068]
MPDNSMTSILAKEPNTVVTKRPMMALGIKDEHTTEKIKNIADVGGFLGAVAAFVFGVVIWYQTNDGFGFAIGLLVAGGGMFASYFILMLLHVYADMITNSIEQTKILKRLEAQGRENALRRSAEEQAQAAAASETAAPVSPGDNADIALSEPDASQSPAGEQPGTSGTETAVSTTENNPTESGAADVGMRREAHFPKRTGADIVCPVCGRKQSSDMDFCYFCDCRFIYDEGEPAQPSAEEILDILRQLPSSGLSS